MDEFIKSLNLNINGIYENNKYIIKVSDSDDYGRLFSKLDSNQNLEAEDSFNLSLDGDEQIYKSDKYKLTLSADFNDDKYQLVIEEL